MPTNLQVFNVFDTIRVQAHVSDPDGLKSVNVSLTNGQPIPVVANVPVTVTGNNMSFTCSYIINNIHLASGSYFLTVSASNSTNTSHAYQQIYVNAAPTKREMVYAITRTVSGTQVWQLDSLFHVTAGASVSSNFSASDISSYYQQLYIAGYDTGNVTAVGYPNNETWQIAGVTSPTPYFTNVYSYGNAAYISYYSGYIKYYDYRGILQQAITTQAFYYPLKTFVWNNYLFAEEKSINSNSEDLVLYYTGSGTGYQQSSLPGPLIAIYGMDNDDLFIFGNQTTGPYMEIYKVSGNIFSTPYTLPNAKLLSAVQISSVQFLIGFDDGNIYQYTYNPVNFLTYVSGINADHMKYDPVNNQLIVASNKTVQEYNCGSFSATLAHTTALPDSVLDVQILFNK
jgi:hypothetical protein